MQLSSGACVVRLTTQRNSKLISCLRALLSSLCTDLLKNKSRPEEAAEGAAEWVIQERELRERLKKEREARELKEKLEVSLRCDFILCF